MNELEHVLDFVAADLARFDPLHPGVFAVRSKQMRIPRIVITDSTPS